MIEQVKFPKVSTNMEEGTLLSWCVKEGDLIQKGQMIAEILTEKAAFDFESPCDGILRKILATEKSVLPPGFVFALIGDESEALPDVQASNESLMESLKAGQISVPSVALSPESSPKVTASKMGVKKVRATPAARRLARQHEVELVTVSSANDDAEPVTEEMVRNYVDGQ